TWRKLPMLSKDQKRTCANSDDDFSGLKAVIANATLKPPGEASHTDTLLDVVEEIFASQSVAVDRIRLSEYRLAPGVYPDMREHGWEYDDWPKLSPRVLGADIIVL